MKTKHFVLMCLAVVGMGISSCEKDDVTPPDDGTTETGNIKASISYSPLVGSSVYVYFLSENFTVKLKQNGVTIATQTTPLGTLDMGVYEYGSYEVQVTGKEGRTNISTGSTNNSHRNFNQTKSLTLDAPTRTVSFSF